MYLISLFNLIQTTKSVLKTFYVLGAVFQRLDEKRAQSKQPVTQGQKLGYAYNW